MSAERRLFIAVDDAGNLGLGGPWAVAELKGLPTTTAGQATPVPALLVAANARRKSLAIYNNDVVTVFFAADEDDDPITVGFPIPPGACFTDNITRGAWYSATEAGNADLRILEVSDE